MGKTRASAEECQQLCQESKRCVVFTYNIAESKCWIKYSATGKMFYPGTISGPKYCTGIYIDLDKPIQLNYSSASFSAHDKQASIFDHNDFIL